MKAMNKLFLVFSPFVLFLLVSGCSNTNVSKTLVIENPKGYEGILVSDASSLVKTDGYEEVFVKSEDKANELIDLLNGKELFEPNEKEIQKRTATLEQSGSYRVLLYNKPSVNSKSEDILPFLFYQDGTIQVDKEGTSYFIKNPPKDLLTQLKTDWNIKF
ncbi:MULTISPECIES: hypothetical protein [Planococcus]|uniref:Lipoprotein n=1 Tax=Planococcus faecalis TaxID=1598147 RepID=A0ABM6ISD5_9BACL|nr:MULTISPECIES: hypothetical protein [Planococcus]AQU79513.1 hypothetical protein AJGP001_09675 [Planococcus faecalis]MDJ0332895.1 hypothetical protein [Planococcus sp. S3-L1]OHX51940.1 hypothetical protein BB777_14345 [Planococcus faecalis]